VSVLGISRDDREDTGIYTVPLSGGEPSLLAQKNDFGNWTGFEWASSGKAVYVECEDRWVHNAAKFTVNPRTMAIETAERITAGDGWEMQLASSHDDHRLAFTLSRMMLRLWTFPFDAATGRILGNGEPVTESGEHVSEWDLSRDGNTLAYNSHRIGSPQVELWTTDLTSGRSRRLAADSQGRDTPRWSRDGHRLAYRWWRQTPTGEHETAAAIRDMDTDEERLITSPDLHGFVLPFDWAPDGQSILASSSVSRKGLRQPDVRLGFWPLAAAPRAENAVRVIASDAGYQAWQGRVSPDGRWICFNGIALGDPEASGIFVIPSSGAERPQWTLVSGERGWADKPAWSPDGRLLYFIRRQGSLYNLWAVAFDTTRGAVVGHPFQVTQFDNPRWQYPPRMNGFGADTAMSPHRLILPILEQTGNIWVLDNVNR